MERLAGPEQIHLSEYTRRLVEGYFKLRDLGASSVAGTGAPVGIYELEAVSTSRTRLEVARARGSSRFVGREDETRTLDSALERAREGHMRWTSGNPFYTEELVRELVEARYLAGSPGAYQLMTDLDALPVPANVRAVLAALIDRLGEREKQVLQAAAVIGKDFPEPILKCIFGENGRSPLAETDLGAALRTLTDAEFIYEQALYPVAEYAFKHPLTQEVALGSQLQERRRRTHAEVARASEEAQADRSNRARHRVLVQQRATRASQARRENRAS